MPGFAGWLAEVATDGGGDELSAEARAVHDAVQRLGGPERLAEAGDGELQPPLLALAAHYFLMAKGEDGRVIDPVARFHLGNGARLERINWMADRSPKSLREAFGLMVNYRYDLKEIEKNHEAYANEGAIAASRGVRALIKTTRGKGKPAVSEAKQHPALPAPPAVKVAP
jgi:malonyl-CoA decarboxylase